MKKKIIFLLLCILIIFTVAQLSASTHHFDSEGFCIQSSQAKVIDLRIEDANITLYNNAHKNGTGYSVASGDINNDGTDDFIISTISSIPSIVLPERANVVQAIFGKSDFPATTAINLSDIDTVDLTIFWQHPSSSDFGFSVATGDINGDGIPDIAMTSRRAVFALYGSENLRGLINLAVQDANISIDFNGVSSYFGFSIALGDVNGDSFDDLVFSDSQYKEGGDDTGKVYVVYGRGDGNFRLDLLAEGADITIRGERAGNWIGNDLAVEDINNDGIEDILIGARDVEENGEGYIIFGSRDFPPRHVIKIDANTVTIVGENPNDRFGNSVAIGDINADGLKEILIGAPKADIPGKENIGKAYILDAERIKAGTNDILSLNPVIVVGENAGDHLGNTVSVGDINADLINDIAIGAAENSDPSNFDSELLKSYLFYGTKEFLNLGRIDLSTQAANITILEDNIKCNTPTGMRLSNNNVCGFEPEFLPFAAGDINADFVNDIILGMPSAVPLFMDLGGEGNGYVIYGEGCPCDGLLEIKPGKNQGELKHGCSPGTWKIGQRKIGWNQG